MVIPCTGIHDKLIIKNHKVFLPLCQSAQRTLPGQSVVVVNPPDFLCNACFTHIGMVAVRAVESHSPFVAGVAPKPGPRMDKGHL